MLRQGAGLEIAGPFRSAANCRPFFAELRPIPNRQPFGMPAFSSRRSRTRADPDPPRWGAMLVLGRIPDFPLTVSPSVSQYAAAWLGGKADRPKENLAFSRHFRIAAAAVGCLRRRGHRRYRVRSGWKTLPRNPGRAQPVCRSLLGHQAAEPAASMCRWPASLASTTSRILRSRPFRADPCCRTRALTLNWRLCGRL